jgi:tetrahydromethanopterin S-methyltransferase subunit F
LIDRNEAVARGLTLVAYERRSPRSVLIGRDEAAARGLNFARGLLIGLPLSATLWVVILAALAG